MRLLKRSLVSAPLITLSILTLVMFLAFLPVTSLQLAIKNDFFQAYFPMKYYLSESLKSGSLPVWNPFLNYGFPIYGDMSESYWNPLTWIMALAGYNAYSFTIEELIYILAAGAGMYKLSGIWMSNKQVRIATAIMYMCSGFMTGQLQHFNWISATALLPFCVYSFWKMMHLGGWKYLASSLFFFSWLISSSHPGMIIGAILFFFIITVYLLWNSDKRTVHISRGSIFILLLLLLCTGIIIGYADVLPYTNRAGAVLTAQMAQGSTNPSSWISFMLPLATTTPDEFFNTDPSLRNCYIGLLPFISLFSIIRAGKKDISFFFLPTGIFFMVISTALLIPIYEHIPLISYVRLTGEFRIFGMLLLLLAGMIQFEKMINSKDPWVIRAIRIFQYILAIALAVAIYQVAVNKGSVLFMHGTGTGTPLKDQIKTALHSLTWADNVIIQGIVQMVLLQVFMICIRSGKLQYIVHLVAIEFILATLMLLPFTGVGRTSLKETDQMISKSPQGILKPYQQAESAVSSGYPETEKFIGSWAFYSKYAALNESMYYPLFLQTTQQYFSTGIQKQLAARPFAFFRNSDHLPECNANTYTSYSYIVNNSEPDTLSIKQNYFKGWRGYIDGKETQVFPDHISLVSISVPPGKHEISLQFNDIKKQYLLISHLIIMLILFLYLLIMLTRKYSSH